MTTAKPQTQSGTQGKDAKTKQSSLMGFFGKPKPGPPPSRPSSSAAVARPAARASSPASTALRTPSSLAGSSPADSRPVNGEAARARVRAASPLKRDQPVDIASGDELSPPPKILPQTVTAKVSAGQIVDAQMDEPDSPPIGSRRTKRKMNYVESDSEDGDDDDEFGGRRPGAATARQVSRSKKAPRASSDNDDFVLDDADDALFAAAAAEQEAYRISASPSLRSPSASPPPRQKKPAKPARKNGSFVAPSSLPTRPGPRPLTNSNSKNPSASGSITALSTQDMFLTAAEMRKEQLKADSKDEDVFEFLKPPLDGMRRPQDDPEYDPRTLYISKRQLEALKPFERQFWSIKKDHFDTVLFFQKGKFYELYEGDAAIGHQEFDLKLTDRVRMKMVGVPEQSFEFWAAKFLAAGYKVGKVEQAETAIGAEMRRGTAGAGKAKGKGKRPAGSDDEDEGGGGGNEKIVRRELKQIFTNGTIVDGAYLTSDEANHCVAIKEYCPDLGQPSSFGICVLDASTGEFNLTAFDDDVCRTRLETMFRQVRPKELVYAKGNLTVNTTRALRNILPASTQWQPFRDQTEFYSANETLEKLTELFETEADEPGTKPELPAAIEEMLDNALAMEALGGMLFYLQSLNLDKDLITQRNFNVYDPIREGKNLVLDGQTLGHMEVLVNNEGGEAGTLLELLQRTTSPFGKRLFRIWLTSPLRDIDAINERLDAVEDLMNHASFTGSFTQMAKGLPDLERLISRIHAGHAKQTEFTRVIHAFVTLKDSMEDLLSQAESFRSRTIAGLLRTMPDLKPHLDEIQAKFSEERTEKTMELVPCPGADEECDEADVAVKEIEADLSAVLQEAKTALKKRELIYWHSAQGGKEIYQIQVPAETKVPANWVKQSGTKNYSRYYTPQTIPLIRKLQEARETQTTAKKGFYARLLSEFDQDRAVWLKAVRVVAELDCLVSLAKSSAALDEPKCRPTFVPSDSAFVEFTELRHPSMCLRADFIANDVTLGGDQPRQVLLTGPNMAGKSTLLRMTAAGIIMAQMGCYVPAERAVLAPVDKIQTRMGAYDNMFASASTFKVELDECSKILREAGPRSFVILDELGRGTSTYDGMAIAGAVLHHLATHTLPLGFFATHYGSLTDDFSYHPNIRKMHMQTHVDDEQMQVVFLYKLIPGVAESSHGTHVARLAGVPEQVVARADQVSAEFFAAFKAKREGKRRSDLPLDAHADFAWLIKLLARRPAAKAASGAMEEVDEPSATLTEIGVGPDGKGGAVGQKLDLVGQLGIIREAVARYAVV